MSKLLIITLLFFTYSCAQVRAINNDQLQEYLKKNIVVIDIRTEKLWNKTGIIPQSYKVNFYNEKGKANQRRWLYIFARLVRNKSTLFVLVSQKGKEAKEVAELLHEDIGYQKVLYLKNGISAWIDDDRKVIDF